MTVGAPTAPVTVAPAVPPPPRPATRRLPAWAALVLWVMVAPLGLVALVRIMAWDRSEPFAVLDALTLFVYLPAWIIAGVAVVGRRYWLAAAAGLVVLAQIVFLLPELTAAEPLPAWAAHAPTVRLFDANVFSGNRSMAGYAAEIKRYRPQLLTLEEASPTDAAQLRSSGALAHLPYSVAIQRFDNAAFFVASSYPVTLTRVAYGYYQQPLIVEVALHLPGGVVAPVWVVHTVAPLPSSFAEWRTTVSLVDRAVRDRGPDGLLLVGDFNSTWGNQGFRQILDAGMTDGAAARARPFQMTWSQHGSFLPVLARIDHVLTGPGVAVTTIASSYGPGSDHRDLQATVAFQR